MIDALVLDEGVHLFVGDLEDGLMAKKLDDADAVSGGEVAQFIAGLMRDPTVNKRFQLRSWELKPGPDAGPGGGGQLLNIIIVLSERV